MARDVNLTSADRVLFPRDRITKGQLFEYYDAVADVLVPHLRDRPFTMKRWREGIRGPVFFQKQAPKGMPDWIPTRQYRTVRFPLVNSREALLWMVQMHCIDMNAWYSRVDAPARPDFVLFDLDPPESRVGFRRAVEVALLVRDAVRPLESFVKTSGAGGIHGLVPIARRSSYERTHAYAGEVSKRLEAEHPGLVTTEWLKEKRRGGFLRYPPNAWGKTIASVYSVRPKPGAPVSTPLHWEELTEDVTPRDFGMAEAPHPPQ